MLKPLFNGVPDFVFFAYLALFLIAYFLVALAGYILRSIGLALHARRFKIECPMLAVVPFAQDYIYGLIVRKIGLARGKNGPLRNMHMIKPIATVLYVVLYFAFRANGAVFILAFLLVFLAVNIVCFYGFLRGFYPRMNFMVALHVALSVLIPLYSGIIMLTILKRKSV